MSDTEPEATPAAEPDHDAEPDRIRTLDSIAEKVDKLWDMLKGGDGAAKAGPEPEPASIGDEVKRELARLKAAEDRKKAADAKDGRIAELEEKVKRIAEKPPKEYRKVTQRMWGEE